MKMAEPEINAFLTYLAVKEHVGATMIYTHVLNKGGHGMRQPNRRFMSRYIQSVYNDTIESMNNIFAMDYDDLYCK